MPFTEQTKQEMIAGARAVAAANGLHVTITPDYMEAVFNTQKRMAAIRAWEKEGVIAIEKRQTVATQQPGWPYQRFVTWTVVHVGPHEFEDRDAEMKGIFPSELLLAQVALCLAAGEAEKPRGV